MMHRVALLIGGNQGDRQALIEQATELIRQRIGSVVAVSKIHETAPWGEFEEERGERGEESGERGVGNFLNRALLVETHLLPHDVLREALTIEDELGRRRKESGATSSSPRRLYHSRTMDIDLIFYDDAIVDTPDLQIPHPRAHLRRFVLEPLAEIMPDYRHPISGMSVVELLAGLHG